jgi:hypothetical protein
MNNMELRKPDVAPDLQFGPEHQPICNWLCRNCVAKLPLNGAAYSSYRGKQPDGYERNDFNEIKKGERK